MFNESTIDTTGDGSAREWDRVAAFQAIYIAGRARGLQGVELLAFVRQRQAQAVTR